MKARNFEASSVRSFEDVLVTWEEWHRLPVLGWLLPKYGKWVRRSARGSHNLFYGTDTGHVLPLWECDWIQAQLRKIEWSKEQGDGA